MITLAPSAPAAVAAIGAHCDDLAIGAGGTLAALCAARPGLTVNALVMTGAGTDREAEERAALQAFCPGADLTVTVLGLPDGRLPGHWDRVKTAIEDLRAAIDPALILAPHRGDAHQDHRLIAELVPTAFRDHLILGYEIVKWDGDLGAPSVFQPLDRTAATRKVSLLREHYASQRHRSWYDDEAFLGLAKIRGVECGAPYAEAFYCSKITVDLAGR